jgi:hypothetical protein
MSILEYIRSKVRVSLTDENINAILLDRGMVDGTLDASLVTNQMRELLYADALMLIVTSPTSSGGTTYEHGGFSQKIGNEVIQNVGRFEQIAMDIYRKWDDDKFTGDGQLTWVDNDY